MSRQIIGSLETPLGTWFNGVIEARSIEGSVIVIPQSISEFPVVDALYNFTLKDGSYQFAIIGPLSDSSTEIGKVKLGLGNINDGAPIDLLTLIELSKPLSSPVKELITLVSLPVGGDEGQILAKATDENYDAEWIWIEANSSDAFLLDRANHTGTQTASTISDFDTEVANNLDVAANTAKVSNVDHPLVETAVPIGALFTDTIYDDTSIQAEVDLNTAKVSNVDHPLVETAVPIGALFTDTIYDDTSIQAEVDLNTAKVSNVDHPLVETAVPIGALFTDTIYDDTSIQAEVDLNTAKVSNVDHPLVETAVPIGALFTDTIYDDTSIQAEVDLNTAKVSNVDHPLVETAVPIGALFTDTIYDDTSIQAEVDLNTAKVSNVDHPLVETAVPIGALFTDTIYDDTSIQAEVDLNTAKVSNVDHPLVETAVPIGALFTDTIYDDTSIQAEVDLNTAKVSNVDHPLVETAVPIGALFTDTIYDDTSIQAEVDLNTTHRGSDGSDHTFIDQDVTTTSSPTFVDVNPTGLVDGRDIAVDGTKLDGIEVGAEVNNISDVDAGDLTDGGATVLHKHHTEDILYNGGTTAHLDTLQEFINHAWSAGSGGEAGEFDITENGDGTVDVTGGIMALRSAENDTADLKPYDVSGVTNLAFTDNTDNYIICDYNAGSPVITSTDNIAVILTLQTKTILYALTRVGTHLNIIDVRGVNIDYSRKNNIKDFKVNGFEHASGAAVSDAGTRNIAVTASEFYALNQSIVSATFDTSGGGSFEYLYRDGVGGYTRVDAQTQIDNTNWDDGTGTLNTLGNNKYMAHYVYLVLNTPSHYKVVYGHEQHNSLAGAQAEGIPITASGDVGGLSTSVLIAKIIVQAGVDAFQDIQSPFTKILSSTAVSNHNNLSGLQGGTVGDYQHLTTGQVAEIAANTLKVSNVDHPLVETAVPVGAVFTDTLYDDTAIQAEVTLNSNDRHTHTNKANLDVIDQDLAITDTPTFEGLILNNTLDMTHTAIEDDDHAAEIDVYADGYGDVKALDIVYVTGGISAGQDEAVILINVDESASSGGEVIGLEVLATEGDAKVDAILAGVGVGPIEQLSGTFSNMTSALVDGVDKLADLTNSGVNTTLFVNDNDTLTLGNTVKFEEIEFLLSTLASQKINPAFEYSTGVGTWASFTPTDGTNGLKVSGVVAWLDADIPAWAVGASSEYLIRITRLRNNITTLPAASLVQIAQALEYHWNKEGDLSVNNILTAGTVNGRDVVADGVKIDLNTAKVSNVDHPLVETAVPIGALFTDTIYDDTAIQAEVTLNTAKVSNVDHPLVETAVPIGALFTDTIYDDTAIQAEVTLNTAKVSNVDHPLVETAVPIGALFTDTIYDDTAIQAEVTLNTAKVSNVDHPLVETAVPIGALFTDTIYDDTAIQAEVTLNTAKVSNVDHPLVETAVPIGALFTDTIYDDTAIQAEVTLNTAKVSNVDHPLVETAVPIPCLLIPSTMIQLFKLK